MRKPQANKWMNREITVLEMKWNLVVVLPREYPLACKFCLSAVTCFLSKPKAYFQGPVPRMGFLMQRKTSHITSMFAESPQPSCPSPGERTHTTKTQKPVPSRTDTNFNLYLSRSTPPVH